MVLNVADHIVDSLLSFFILVVIRFMHVFLDCFSSLHSEMVFDDIDVFVYLWNLFIFVQKCQI